MKSFTILCALLLGFLVASVASNDYEAFRKKHGKTLTSSAEKTKRTAVYAKNMKQIAAMNAAAKKNNESVVFGETKFCDLETHEFLRNFTGFKKSSKPSRKAVNLDKITNSSSTSLKTAKAAVTSFDWTTKSGIVSPVKDQGDCGSCWAFGSVAAVESYYARKSGKAVTQLSEQQVNDCDSPPNDGCDGGDHYEALLYLQSTGAIKESVYPYTATDGTCKKKSVFVKANYFRSIYQTSDETKMMSLLQSNGPMAVGLDATVLQNYNSGVISSCSSDINHVVLLVGFGTDSKTKQNYWRLKNQWGTDWGENGYFRLLRNKNMCGIAEEVYYLA